MCGLRLCEDAQQSTQQLEGVSTASALQLAKLALRGPEPAAARSQPS